MQENQTSPLNSDDEFNHDVFTALKDDDVCTVKNIMEYFDLTDFSIPLKKHQHEEILGGNPSTLCLAAYNGSVESFRYLLANGSSIDQKDDYDV